MSSILTMPASSEAAMQRIDGSFEASSRDVPPSAVGRERLIEQVAFEATWEQELAIDRVSWSGGFASLFGYAPDEMVEGVAWWKERVHPDNLNRVERTFNQALSSGALACLNEYRFLCKDGSWAWVSGRVAIERDPHGRPVRAIGAMIDVTKLKETEERLRLFTEQIPARACATDRELRVVWDLGAGFPSSPPPWEGRSRSSSRNPRTASGSWRSAVGPSRASRASWRSTTGRRPRCSTSGRSAIRPET